MLTDKLLADVGQLWLLFPAVDSRRQLSDDERQLVATFNEQGNGMLVALGNGRNGDASDTSINRLSSSYGVQFSGNADSGTRVSVGMASQLFSSASELLGKFLKIVHKA